MAEITNAATGARVVLSEGFIVHGDTNQSDGMGPRYEVGRYDNLEEARQAARGKGVQGDSGTVGRFQVASYAGGAVRTEETPLIQRRQVPSYEWLVGFVDLREYEYGIRLAAGIPVRPYDGSIFARKKFVLEGEDAEAIEVIDSLELRKLLRKYPEDLVGLWRKRGDTNWRGEFPGGTDQQLDRWLASESTLDRWGFGDHSGYTAARWRDAVTGR